MKTGWQTLPVSKTVKKLSTVDKKIKQKEALTNGNFPVIDQGQDYIAGYYNDPSKVIDAGPVIIFGDHTKAIKFVDFPFVPGADGTKVLKPNPELFAPKLFYYFLQSIKFPDKGYARHYQHLEKELINIPPLSEQEKMVAKIEELISEIENAESNLRNGLQQIELYNSLLLSSLFKSVTEVSEHETLPPIPMSWSWVKNEELLRYVTSGSRDWKKYYSDTGAMFVRTQDINKDQLDLTDVAFVRLPEKVEGKRSLIEPGDLLMTITGANVGKVAVVEGEIPEAYVSQSVALMKYKNRDYSRYLHYYFQARGYGMTFIQESVYGIGRPVLSLKNMRDVLIALPPDNEINKIVEDLDASTSYVKSVKCVLVQQLKQVGSLKTMILRKAFEGELL